MTGLSRTAWTPAEDERLLMLRELGVQYRDLPQHMPGRSYNACTSRAHDLACSESGQGGEYNRRQFDAQSANDAYLARVREVFEVEAARAGVTPRRAELCLANGRMPFADVDQAAARLLSGVGA